jgi:hypothetical protein
MCERDKSLNDTNYQITASSNYQTRDLVCVKILACKHKIIEKSQSHRSGIQRSLSQPFRINIPSDEKLYL